MANDQPPQVGRGPLYKIALGALAIAALSGVWLGSQRLSDPNVLPLHEVRITGQFEHISMRDAQRAVMPFLAQGFLGVDMAGIRQTFRLLPWVETVSVRRIWPDVLEVELIEQTPVAYWGDQALVNDKGVLFTPQQMPGDLPLARLDGPRTLVPEMTQRMREIGNMLAPLELRVTGLKVDDRRAWSVQINGGMELLLGRSDNHERLVRFIGAYNNMLAGYAGTIERVDLRYTNGMAVSIKNLPAAEQNAVKGAT